MNRNAPRLQDVARKAGVSTATVSRALSKPEVVSAQTLQVVLQAVKDTGYTVNEAARNLRQQRTGGVVAVVPNLANPFFSRILSGMASVLATAGYSLLVADSQGPDGGPNLVHKLNRSRADGLIVLDGAAVPVDATPDLPPVLLACEWADRLDLPTIRVDNAAGARLAVRHLTDLGHRLIGHVRGPGSNVLSRARAEAARHELAAAGLPLREDWFLSGDFSLASGQAAGEAWLRMEDRPTAVFCSSDEMACGFIGHVQRHGVRVPADVSVVGFDDIELVAHITPALTTIHQPREQIGETAARLMLDLMLGGEPTASTVLPVELIVRDSTAPPPR